MEFSALMYEVSVEIKNFEKDLKNDDEQLNQKIIQTISNLEKANYKLELKSKGIELSKKKLNKDFVKEKNEKLFYENKIVETKKKIQNMVTLIKNLKSLDKDIQQEKEQYIQQIQEKSAEIEKSIVDKINFSDNELQELQKENERMKNDVQALVNLYNQKREEHVEKCKTLQEEYLSKQKDQSEKLAVLQTEVDEYNQLEKYHKELKNENQSIRLKASNFQKAFEQYLKICQTKKENYETYLKSIQEKVDELYYKNKRNQEIETLDKKVGDFYLQIMSENTQLENQLKQEQKNTEVIKQQCKELQLKLKNK